MKSVHDSIRLLPNERVRLCKDVQKYITDYNLMKSAKENMPDVNSNIRNTIRELRHKKAKSPQDCVPTSGASPIEEPTAPAEASPAPVEACHAPVEASSAPIEGNYF